MLPLALKLTLGSERQCAVGGMPRFRPCIDLRDGRVVQIVGGSLRDGGAGAAAPSSATTNFTATLPAEHFGALYARRGLTGGHVIMLGGGNDGAARAALRAFPGGLQVGGGITPASARGLLDEGASHVIVTSFVFREGRIDRERLAELVAAVGRERLVLDLSCRKRRRSAQAGVIASDGAITGVGASAGVEAPVFEYVVVTDRWQRWTDCVVDAATLRELAAHCAEFLVHGVDVEGLRQGVDDDLVALLGDHCPIPVTYAGGVRDMDDVRRVARLGRGRVDVSVGSALDIFGGSLPLDELVAWSDAQQQHRGRPFVSAGV